MSARILVIDDIEANVRLLRAKLEAEYYEVLTACDGPSGIAVAQAERPDIVLLDVMMPGMDGFEVIKEIRRTSSVPVVMLTARGDELDRIVGLEIGADDYLGKPFNPRELLARMQAVLRRSATAPESQSRLVAGGLVVDPDRREVVLDGEVVPLTTTEFEILRTLVASAGRVIPRERLMELARGEDFAAFDRSVDVHVSHIRKKLGDDPKTPRYVKTVRGVGYTVPKDPG